MRGIIRRIGYLGHTVWSNTYVRCFRMARQYFACSYRLDSEDRHLIWYTNEHDGVIIDGVSEVPSFKNLDALQTYALNHGWIVNAKEPVLHDLDETARWLEAPTASVKCVNALCAW